MTITTPRAGYLRSSENTTEAERQEAHEVRHLSKLEAADPRGFDWEDERREIDRLSYGLGARNSGLVTKPSFEELYDAMLAEDLSTYDADGQVR